MKNIITLTMRNLFFLICLMPAFLLAQDKPNDEPAKPTDAPVKATFKSGVLIDNQTTTVYGKNRLEFMIQHRFGKIKDESNMFGLFDPANIRFGVGYGVNDKLNVGIGVTKNKHVYDLNLKYLALRQTKSGRIPVSVAYYGELCRSGLPDENFTNAEGKYNQLNRLSYFNEVMVARKFSENISVQAACTYSYFNIIETGLQNGTIGASVLGRYKFSQQSSIIFDVDYPITTHSDKLLQPKPNIGIGLEVATSGHQFQVFIATGDGILNNTTRVYTQNDPATKFAFDSFVIGFNINRLWSF